MTMSCSGPPSSSHLSSLSLFLGHAPASQRGCVPDNARGLEHGSTITIGTLSWADASDRTAEEVHYYKLRTVPLRRVWLSDGSDGAHGRFHAVLGYDACGDDEKRAYGGKAEAPGGPGRRENAGATTGEEPGVR